MHAQYNVQIKIQNKDVMLRARSHFERFKIKLKSTFSPAGSSIILRLKYHQAFVEINHVLLDTGNVTKHAEHDGIKT